MRRGAVVVAVLLLSCALPACSSLHSGPMPRGTASTPTPAAARSTPVEPALDAPAVGVVCPTPDASFATGNASPSIGPLAPPVVFDGGRLRIDPPLSGARPQVSLATARQNLLTTVEVSGSHSCVGLGLAAVTLDPGDGPVAARDHRLMWVGIAHDGTHSCPARLAASTFYAGPAPVTVVLIDAAHPRVVEVYVSRGTRCGEEPTGPAMSPGHQLVSVAFQELGDGEVAFDMPPCAISLRASSLFDPKHGGSAEIDVSVPFSPPPDCASQPPTRQRDALSVPAGGVHAPVGPRLIFDSFDGVVMPTPPAFPVDEREATPCAACPSP